MVRQKSEQAERVVLPIPGIENNNLILVGNVVLLIERQQFIHPYIRIHGAHAMDEDVRPSIFILDVHMRHNMLMEEVDEPFGMRVTGKR